MREDDWGETYVGVAEVGGEVVEVVVLGLMEATVGGVVPFASMNRWTRHQRRFPWRPLKALQTSHGPSNQ